jgi:hypothetical protein
LLRFASNTISGASFFVGALQTGDHFTDAIHSNAIAEPKDLGVSSESHLDILLAQLLWPKCIICYLWEVLARQLLE